MKARYKDYIGEVIPVGDIFLFYTFDERAKEYLWPSYCERGIPAGAYCYWLREDEFTVLGEGRRSL